MLNILQSVSLRTLGTRDHAGVSSNSHTVVCDGRMIVVTTCAVYFLPRLLSCGVSQSKCSCAEIMCQYPGDFGNSSKITSPADWGFWYTRSHVMQFLVYRSVNHLITVDRGFITVLLWIPIATFSLTSQGKYRKYKNKEQAIGRSNPLVFSENCLCGTTKTSELRRAIRLQ